MASSRGIDTYNKYYRGKKEVTTMIKKTTSGYDVDDMSRAITSIKIGEVVVVHPDKSYNSKILVYVPSKEKFYRVQINDVAKPGNAKSISATSGLKPQAFDIVGKDFYLDEYVPFLIAKIDERSDLPIKLRTYLYNIVEYYNDNEKKESVTEIFNSSFPINQINNDFGEVLGPIAIIKKQILKEKSIKIPSRSRILFPIRANEPLVDYYIKPNSKESYKISAKVEGKKSNTVKPADLIGLIEKNKEKHNYWRNKKQFKVLQILAAESILTGSFLALGFLGVRGANQMALKEIKKYKSKTNIDKSVFASFINSDPYLRSKAKHNITIEEINYASDQILCNMSKTNKDMDFSGLFKDAISEFPIYVKFNCGNDGLGRWSSIVSDDINKQSVYLRSKSTRNSTTDKLGIQT